MIKFRFDIDINGADEFALIFNEERWVLNRSGLEDMRWAIDQALNTSGEELDDA